ncbi:MAG TPA: hypothetical protein PLM07_02270 [Candidatus Rifleibacterium sp.]|nr:hypothetical protein [Candidatus Rifleibacterium sp.]HPT44707.1 hypothetical protein [Candidatus Rifleibacterium sp.]
MPETVSRSMFEKLLYLGIATFFLWPFVQLWSVKALPLFDSDSHLRAAVALENLMETALSRPFERSFNSGFEPVKGCEDLDMLGKIEIATHPDFPANVLVRAQVRWGMFPLSKNLYLECLRARTRP